MPREPHRQGHAQESHVPLAVHPGGTSTTRQYKTLNQGTVVTLRRLVFFSLSGKNATFEQRRLTVISGISGFTLIWGRGGAKVLPDCTFSRTESTFTSAGDVSIKIIQPHHVCELRGQSSLAPQFKSIIVFLQHFFYMCITRVYQSSSFFYFPKYVILFMSSCIQCFYRPSFNQRKMLEEF